MAIIWRESFKVKDEVPTCRFWLMCKMKFKGTKSEDLFDKRWNKYMNNLKKDLIENMKFVNSEGKEKVDKEIIKRTTADETIKKIERSSYLTIPASFLTSLNIPRVLRH